MFCLGDMLVYVGGQQPYQRVNVGSNVLQAQFTIAAWCLSGCAATMPACIPVYMVGQKNCAKFFLQ